MAISLNSSLFSSPSFAINAKQSSDPISNSISFRRARISAAFATADRTDPNTTRSFNCSNKISLYEVLGVPIGADMRQVKSAYRRLARVLHPDVCESSTDEFMKVQSAYATLADPAKRAEYDRNLIVSWAGGLSPVRSDAGYYTVASRRWETDQCW